MQTEVHIVYKNWSFIEMLQIFPKSTYNNLSQKAKVEGVENMLKFFKV